MLCAEHLLNTEHVVDGDVFGDGDDERNFRFDAFFNGAAGAIYPLSRKWAIASSVLAKTRVAVSVMNGDGIAEQCQTT